MAACGAPLSASRSRLVTPCKSSACDTVAEIDGPAFRREPPSRGLEVDGPGFSCTFLDIGSTVGLIVLLLPLSFLAVVLQSGRVFSPVLSLRQVALLAAALQWSFSFAPFPLDHSTLMSCYWKRPPQGPKGVDPGSWGHNPQLSSYLCNSQICQHFQMRQYVDVCNSDNAVVENLHDIFKTSPIRPRVDNA